MGAGPDRRGLGFVGLCLAAVVLAAAPLAAAAVASPAAEAKARLQRDRAACARVRDHDARQNCLSEASTAYARTRPTASDEDPATLARNAQRRCAPLPEADRKDCLARMQGQGTTSGSVGGGGIYRELVTREAEAPRAVQPAASAP